VEELTLAEVSEYLTAMDQYDAEQERLRALQQPGR
jgi:hypothetical protein